MSSPRSVFLRKRRSDDESSSSDSDEGSPQVKRLRHSNEERNIKDLLSEKCKGVIQWVTSLPISNLFKEAVVKKTLLEETIVVDDMDKENNEDTDVIELNDEDITISVDSQIDRRERNHNQDHFRRRRPFTSTPFLRPGRSLDGGVTSCLPRKPINGFNGVPTWTGKDRSQKTRSQVRHDHRPLTNPGLDIEILLDTRESRADDSDELQIVSEMRKRHRTEAISPIFKSAHPLRAGATNGKGSTPYPRKENLPSRRYTAHEVYRLSEKAQYKLLLEKMMRGSTYTPIATKNNTAVEVDLTKDDEPEPAPAYKKEILRAPVEDFFQKYYKPCQLVYPASSPTAAELKQLDEDIIAHDEDIEVVQEVNVPTANRLRANVESELSLTEFINQMKISVNADTEARVQRVRQQEQKIERFKKRRDARAAGESKVKEKLRKLGAISDSSDDEEEFAELTTEMEMIVDNALENYKNSSEKLSELPDEKVQVRGCDIATLAGLNWLNDEVINFYLQLISLRSKMRLSYPSVYAYNSFFYVAMKGRGESKVLRWTKNVDIFAFDILLVPLHLGMHWALCVVDNRMKSIKYYDSMQSSEQSCLFRMQRYLAIEMKSKKNIDIAPTSYSVEIVKNIPQQMNGSDCGMFTLKYAEYVARDALITFTQANMQYFRRKMVYEIITRQLI